MENKQATLELGTKPVGKLLVQYALPAMIAMTASSLYNIVDRVFIGQGVGAMAISGLAITFPFMNLTAIIDSPAHNWQCVCLSSASRSIDMGGTQTARVSDAISVKRGELLRILSLLKGKRRSGDTATQFHYEDVIMRIQTALGQEIK